MEKDDAEETFTWNEVSNDAGRGSYPLIFTNSRMQGAGAKGGPEGEVHGPKHINLCTGVFNNVLGGRGGPSGPGMSVGDHPPLQRGVAPTWSSLPAPPVMHPMPLQPQPPRTTYTRLPLPPQFPIGGGAFGTRVFVPAPPPRSYPFGGNRIISQTMVNSPNGSSRPPYWVDAHGWIESGNQYQSYYRTVEDSSSMRTTLSMMTSIPNANCYRRDGSCH